MFATQVIQKPFGVSVFGSAIIRVEPDVVSLKFAVNKLKKHPKQAFTETRKSAEKVRYYLVKEGLNNIGISRVNLKELYYYTGGERQFTGYNAIISFHLLLHNLALIFLITP